MRRSMTLNLGSRILQPGFARGIISVVEESLERISRELGFTLDAGALARLMLLRGLWLAQGRAINLTGASSDAELLGHIGDGIATVVCASGLLSLDAGTAWLDVGSGGGLPGLIVAALTPVRLTLVEPRQRRAAFLEFALATIGNKSEVLRARLGDATWDKYRMERMKKPGEVGFAVASARAVFAPEEWLGIGYKLVINGGVVIAHLRPGQIDVSGMVATSAVEWQRSRIGAFRVR